MSFKKLSASIIVLSIVVGAGAFSAAQKSNNARAASKGNSKARSSTGANKTPARSGTRAANTSSKRLASRSIASPISSGAPASTGNLDRDCRAQYAYCMDAQIAPMLSRYEYLESDPAVQSVMDTTEPLRCIYYNKNKVKSLFGDNSKYCSDEVIAQRSTITVDGAGNSKTSKKYNNLNFCAAQRDVNDLYMAYNYYCNLNTSTTDAYQQPIRRCALVAVKDTSDKSSVFATKDSYAYFKEANRRTEEGELKIINFEESALYKNKIAGIIADCEVPPSGVDGSKVEEYNKKCAKEAEATWKQFSITADDTSDLLKDLGLTGNSKELFSINVAPPVGAGTMDPPAMFKRASDLCFSGMKLGAAEKQLLGETGEIQKSVSAMLKCAQSYNRSDLERYYLAGTWFEPCEDGYTYNETSGKCVSEEDPSDVIAAAATSSGAGSLTLKETDFHSAKKSCDMYEQALISTRNNEYGKFDTALKNYIEDNIAKMVAKKTKDLAKINNAFMGIKELVNNLQNSAAKMKADAYKARNAAEMAIMQADLDLADMRMDITRQEIEFRKERAALYSEAYDRQIVAICMPKVMGAFNVAFGVNDNYDPRTFLQAEQLVQGIAASVANQSIYINNKGTIKTKIESGMNVAECDMKKGCSNEAGGDGFERVYCMAMPNAVERYIEPVRSDMGTFYDMILYASCTGDSSKLQAAAVSGGYTGVDNEGADGSAGAGGAMAIGGVVAAGGAGIGGLLAAAGTTAAIVPVGTIIAAAAVVTAAVAALFISGLKAKTSTQVSYSSPFIAKGQCYVKETTKTTKKDGWMKGGAEHVSYSYRDLIVPEIKDEKYGKGLERFDTNLLPAVKSLAK